MNFKFNCGKKEITKKDFISNQYKNGNLLVTLEEKSYDEFSAKETLLWFENVGEEDTEIISDILDCCNVFSLPRVESSTTAYIPPKNSRSVITMAGMVDGYAYTENDTLSATEFSLHQEFLRKGQTKSFQEIGSRSSDGMMPFFNLCADNSGTMLAIGWTGSWRASFTECEEGILASIGLSKTNFYLKKGEKIRTASILTMDYTSEEDFLNKFRKLIKNHYSHIACTENDKEGLLAYELWGGLPTEEMLHRMERFKKHNVSFEQTWIDAGWYGQCHNCIDAFNGDWSQHTGEWEVNLNVHPNGLMDVAKKAEEMKAPLMFWIEPERACPGVPITKTHPEWLLKSDTNDNLILYYGIEEAYQYIFNLVCDYAEKFNMACYRQDFNVKLTDYFEKNDEENRQGITEIKHIMGVYRLFDELHQKYPKLLIDNCSSGGRRIDIEMLKRAIIFFRSDYQCEFNLTAEVLQVHNSGVQKYLALSGCTTKMHDKYSVRSAYSSSFGGAFYNAVFQDMTDAELDSVASLMEEYKSIRKYFSKNFYNLGSEFLDLTSWTVWRFHDEELDEGIIMAFRRENSPFDKFLVEFEKEYFVKNLDTEACEKTDKLDIILTEKRSSVIFTYKKVTIDNGNK